MFWGEKSPAWILDHASFIVECVASAFPTEKLDMSITPFFFQKLNFSQIHHPDSMTAGVSKNSPWGEAVTNVQDLQVTKSQRILLKTQILWTKSHFCHGWSNTEDEETYCYRYHVDCKERQWMTSLVPGKQWKKATTS